MLVSLVFHSIYHLFISPRHKSSIIHFYLNIKRLHINVSNCNVNYLSLDFLKYHIAMALKYIIEAKGHHNNMFIFKLTEILIWTLSEQEQEKHEV